MKGDFSHWQFDPNENFSGVLQQQGRVLLDRDWNEQTRITKHWQDQAGRDVIGAGVAAVPVEDPEGFGITEAGVAGVSPNQRIELQVTPGRAWADGLLCYLPPATPGSIAPVLRVADYLQPPIDDTPGSIATIGPGVRDAVILEVSREELSAFQVPGRLLEAALGGPDTTERIHLRMAFKLYRLAPGENCMSIRDELRDDPADKGRLTVQLQPTAVVPGDCPVVMSGGYSGFEHLLYRIEIAALNAAQPASFKWSQFNGGLVGRGQFISGPNRISLTANHAAILNSGLNSFYCEVLAYDADRGLWHASFGADVTLSGSELVVGTVRLGAFSASTTTVFFRLWNGLQPISSFVNAVSPQELLDGIQLVFDPATATNYGPGDFWTFTVRAGEITNPDVLIDDRVPFGPVYHRVSLAEINWGAPGVPVVPPEIEDCRRRFRPLTRLDTCCTFRVGDGITTLGDFDLIQEAIDALPPEGGEICVLPGVFQGPVTIVNRDNITISGCGPRTRLIALPTEAITDAVISIYGGSNITIESLAVEAAPRGRGILALGLNPFSKVDQIAEGAIVDLTLAALHISAATFAGIRAEHIRGLTIRDCELRLEDITSEEHALVVLADDAHIEHNLIEVRALDAPILLSTGEANDFIPGSLCLGGLHLKSLCERVRVIDNHIRGGSGNGITLGSVIWIYEDGEPVPPEDEPEEPEVDPCDPTKPVDEAVDDTPITIGETEARRAAGGPLYDIRIERNRIHAMGANGIGVAGFFPLSALDEFIGIRNMDILGNRIVGCLRRAIAPAPESLGGYIGYGGIALADVENLVVHDNAILDNGFDHLDPVCGVYVLHGEGVDLVRNRIVNNGGRTSERDADARAGNRGGVFLHYALPPAIVIDVGGVAVPAQNGIPAARLHDNIVSAPLGRALTINAVGPVSVVGNQLTSQGVAPASAGALGLLAGSVLILNLGVSNEIYLQMLLFASLGEPNAEDHVGGAVTGALGTPRPGLDDARLGLLLANGQVLFDDNQVNLDLLSSGLSIAFTSTLIVTLDDLGFHDNQCEANLYDDFLIANSVLLGFSLRATGNRWKEGLLNAWLSAFTLTFTMNATTDNQGTHCIVVRGMPTHVVDDHNTVLIQGVLGENPGLCDAFERLLPGLSKREE